MFGSGFVADRARTLAVTRSSALGAGSPKASGCLGPRLVTSTASRASRVRSTAAAATAVMFVAAGWLAGKGTH